MQNIRCQVPAGGILAQHFAEVPSHLFYPGILLMKITWVQSQMARLLVLSEVAALKKPSPGQLWYDESMWPLWTGSLAAYHQSFSQARPAFPGPAQTCPVRNHRPALPGVYAQHAGPCRAISDCPDRGAERTRANYYPLQPQHKDCGQVSRFPGRGNCCTGHHPVF